MAEDNIAMMGGFSWEAAATDKHMEAVAVGSRAEGVAVMNNTADWVGESCYRTARTSRCRLGWKGRWFHQVSWFPRRRRAEER